jgi:hypothetical protein
MVARTEPILAVSGPFELAFQGFQAVCGRPDKDQALQLWHLLAVRIVQAVRQVDLLGQQMRRRAGQRDDGRLQQSASMSRQSLSRAKLTVSVSSKSTLIPSVELIKRLM